MNLKCFRFKRAIVINYWFAYACWRSENLHNNWSVSVSSKKYLHTIEYHIHQSLFPNVTEIHSKSENQAFSTCFFFFFNNYVTNITRTLKQSYDLIFFWMLNLKVLLETEIQKIQKLTGWNQIHIRIGIRGDSHMEGTEARRYITLEWGRNCRFSSLLGCLE